MAPRSVPETPVDGRRIRRTDGKTARRDGRRPLARLPPPRPCRRTDGHHEGASSGDDVDGASAIRRRCGRRIAGNAGVARRHGAGSGRHRTLPSGRDRRRCPTVVGPTERREHLWDDRDRQRCRVRRHTARRRRRHARRAPGDSHQVPHVACRTVSRWQRSQAQRLARHGRRRLVGRRRPARRPRPRQRRRRVGWRQHLPDVVEAALARHESVAEESVSPAFPTSTGGMSSSPSSCRTVSHRRSSRSATSSNGHCPPMPHLAG